MSNGEVILGSAAEMSAVALGAEVDIQIATAKKYPRSIADAQARLFELAGQDMKTAESMEYAVPRAGKAITGYSIRFAEIAAYSWGNLRVEDEVTGTDGDFVVARATAFDLENNLASRSTVRRRITNKHGKRFNADMIQVAGQAAAAIARRNAIFDVIPKALLKGVFDSVMKVADGDEKSFDARKTEALRWWSSKGVESPEVCKLVGLEGKADLRNSHLRLLRGMRQAIEEGTTTIESLLNPVVDTGKAKAEGLRDKVDAKSQAQPETSGKRDVEHDKLVEEAYEKAMKKLSALHGSNMSAADSDAFAKQLDELKAAGDFEGLVGIDGELKELG